MTKSNNIKITVGKDGPYLISGGVPLQVQVITPDKEGTSWDWTEGRTFEVKATYALCRCGHSKNKPFCDGTHSKVEWDGEETASREPYAQQAETMDGPTLQLQDAESLCAFARFCDVGDKIWAQIEETDNPKIREMVIREANHCPSGRLVVKDKKTGPEFKEVEEPLPPSIGVVEDPPMKCSGPLWVRGGISIASADGTPYETRNRVTLCRCGASENKPFCDGGHARVKFDDGFLK